MENIKEKNVVKNVVEFSNMSNKQIVKLLNINVEYYIFGSIVGKDRMILKK